MAARDPGSARSDAPGRGRPRRSLAALAAVLSLGAATARADGAALTLDEALALAARGSPDLALARADTASADADRAASLASLLPRLDLSSSFGHDFAGPSAAPILVAETPALDEASYGLSLQLVQPILDLASLKDVRRAGLAARAAARQYDEAVLSVAFDVTRRFYEVVRAERTLAVLEKTVARSEDLVARADALFAAGRAPKSDTLQARVNLANDRVAVEAQVIRVAQARHALAQALGRDDGADLSAVPPAALEAGTVPPEPPPLAALLAAARERRPALAAQAALVRASDAAVEGARAGYLPVLSAQGSYGRQGQDLAGRDGVYGDPTRAYSASALLVLSWNLFEGRRTQANVRRARAAADRARASLSRTEAQIAAEVADAYAAATVLARQVAIAAGSLSVAEQGLALARERLEAGLASQLEVRDASLKLTQAELSLVQARIDEAVSRADLARAAGGPF